LGEFVDLPRTTTLLIAGFIQLYVSCILPLPSMISMLTSPALALDRIGRRWTMIWGCAGLSICMMMLAALLSNGQKATASAAVTFFFLYMLIFGGTINVVPWGKQLDETIT
jgi:hypothetical protein